MTLLSFISSNLSIIVLIISILLTLMLISNILTYLKLKKIKQANDTLFSGKEARDLESIIFEIADQQKNLDKEVQELFDISKKIYALSFKSINKVGIVRFNPFNDIGGDQSFAVALLNGKKDGVLISSIHTKEGTRVYSKPVINGNSKYKLTDEEIESINQAFKQIK